jgi:hypothetical protein
MEMCTCRTPTRECGQVLFTALRNLAIGGGAPLVSDMLISVRNDEA